MPSDDQVPVFYLDDDTAIAKPFAVWLRSKCREQKLVLGRFIDNGKKFRLFASRPKIYPVTAAMLKPSQEIDLASTISTAQMLANVGIAGETSDDWRGSIPAPRSTVRKARAKVRAYPHIHDNLAPLASGRWYASELLIVSARQ